MQETFTLLSHHSDHFSLLAELLNNNQTNTENETYMLDNKWPQWATDVKRQPNVQDDAASLQWLWPTRSFTASASSCHLVCQCGSCFAFMEDAQTAAVFVSLTFWGTLQVSLHQTKTTSITSLAPPPAGHVCQLSSAVPDCLSLQDSSLLLWSRHRVPKQADFKEQNLLRWVSLTWVDFRCCCCSAVPCACTLNVNTVNPADKL